MRPSGRPHAIAARGAARTQALAAPQAMAHLMHGVMDMRTGRGLGNALALTGAVALLATCLCGSRPATDLAWHGSPEPPCCPVEGSITTARHPGCCLHVDVTGQPRSATTSSIATGPEMIRVDRPIALPVDPHTGLKPRVVPLLAIPPTVLRI